jgi:hypothetical protein
MCIAACLRYTHHPLLLPVESIIPFEVGVIICTVFPTLSTKSHQIITDLSILFTFLYVYTYSMHR